MKRLNVAHIFTAHWRSEYAVAYYSPLALIEALETEGIDSEILIPGHRSTAELTPDFDLRYFRPLSPWIGVPSQLESIVPIKNTQKIALGLFFHLLFRRDIDLVHLHGNDPSTALAACAAACRGIPILSTTLGFPDPSSQCPHKLIHPNFGGMIKRWLNPKRQLSMAEAVIGLSHQAVEEIQCRQRGSKRIVHIPRGISSPRAAERERLCSEESRSILCALPSEDEGQITRVVEAFKAFHRLFPNFRLILLLPPLSPSSPSITRSEGYTLLKAPVDAPMPTCQIYCAPFTGDFPTQWLLRAMSLGVPSISTQRNRELTPHVKNALLLCDDCDSSGLLRALCRLASDPALCKALSEAGSKFSAHWEWKAIAQRTICLYREVLDNYSFFPTRLGREIKSKVKNL